MIYIYFVSVDQHFLWDGNETPFECTVLQINRQIHDEAWDCLIRSNVWVRFTLPYAPSIPEDHWYPQPRLLYKGIPKQYQNRLASEVGIHFRLNGDMTASQGDTYIFLYHPLTYGVFIHDIAMAHSTYTSLTVEVNPAISKPPSFVRKLIEPLYSVRDYEDVTITGIGDDTKRQALIRQMRRTSDTIEELLAVKGCYHGLGRRAELDGRHSDAISLYALCIESTYDASDRFPQGSPEDNSLNHMDSCSFIAYSRNTHKHIRRLKARAPPITLVKTATSRLLCDTIDACSYALAFVGITDRQRCEAHLYRAFAFYDYAEFQVPFLAKDDLDRLDRNERSLSPCRVTHSDCYLHARRCLFYAQQVDSWQDVLAGLEKDDLQVLNAIQGRPGPQAFELEERKLPLVGPWKGDPDLWNGWPRHESIVMALFRRRHNQGADGEVGVPMDLTAAYHAHGISWSHSGDELVPNLFNIDDPSLLVTI